MRHAVALVVVGADEDVWVTAAACGWSAGVARARAQPRRVGGAWLGRGGNT
jgi:hypothetical protein